METILIRSMRTCALGMLMAFTVVSFNTNRLFAKELPTKNQLDQAMDDSISLLMANLKRSDLGSGVVIASPSTTAPDYFYHWTRDAALTHESLFELYSKTDDANLKNQILTLAKEWIAFEAKTQINSVGSVAGLGEPRFLITGQVNTADWGRPQSDGPAARAITMSLWALTFLDRGEANFVSENLFQIESSATKPIKKDIEYVIANWRKSSFDLWEESKGLHFFNLALQRKSLLMAARLSSRMGDDITAATYVTVADQIKSEMGRFLDAGKPYIVVTLDNDGGWTNKVSAIDVAVTLAANHALFDDEFFQEHKLKFVKTQAVLEDKFYNIYKINKENPNLATAIGRYPEDVYDGVSFSGANPWFIATHASAEFYCKLAKQEPSKTAAAALKKEGLSFLARTLKHRDQATGEMSEQFSRDNGYLVGARHLTWSYASYITAYLACQ